VKWRKVYTEAFDSAQAWALDTPDRLALVMLATIAVDQWGIAPMGPRLDHESRVETLTARVAQLADVLPSLVRLYEVEGARYVVYLPHFEGASNDKRKPPASVHPHPPKALLNRSPNAGADLARNPHMDSPGAGQKRRGEENPLKGEDSPSPYATDASRPLGGHSAGYPHPQPHDVTDAEWLVLKAHSVRDWTKQTHEMVHGTLVDAGLREPVYTEEEQARIEARKGLH
jgi:hypothetical protein